MGLLKWLTGGAGGNRVVTLKGSGHFALNIVGEAYCQDALAKIAGGKTEDGHELEVDALVIPDDNNKHDANAVRIEIAGRKVGHLSRADAVAYRKKIAQAGHPGASGRCRAVITGGWDRGSGDTGHFGVRLDVMLQAPAKTLVV